MSEVVLITGVAGFIGRHVARHFAERGWTIVGIDQIPLHPTPQHLSAYYELRMPHEALSRIVQTHLPQVCIHCAGPASIGLSMTDPSSDFYGSTVATFEILNMLRLHCPTCRFVLVSSAAVYGNPVSLPVREEQLPAPLSPYGFHKWQCEVLGQEFNRVYGLPTASVRIFSAYGSGLRRQVLWDICEKVLSHRRVTLQGTGGESRDFVHVVDIAAALRVVATQGGLQGEAYNLGSGREVSIRDLAGMILGLFGHPDPPQFDGIVPPGTPRNWQANISKLKSLGFTPSVPLEEGLRKFVDWCREERVRP